jgi:hypothetical protein
LHAFSAEPALGPVTCMHRQSESENPEAPLGHHLQDSTHTSFGTVTTGFVLNFAKSALLKVEGSAFNGHKPNEERWSTQLALLDFLVVPCECRAHAQLDRLIQQGIWGRKHKELDNTTQNSYLLESTLNFLARNYAYTRLELLDQDELFPEDPAHPAYRIGAYTFGAVRDLVHSEYGQVGLGGDVTFYSKPAVLDAIYGNKLVSFHVFVRIRAGLMEHGD